VNGLCKTNKIQQAASKRKNFRARLGKNSLGFSLTIPQRELNRVAEAVGFTNSMGTQANVKLPGVRPKRQEIG
jgi:hypothetical protein